jgi:hypothetical protein
MSSPADLAGRRLVLGLSGGIACYKAAEFARALVKAGATVQVVMTDAAREFITPVTMQALTGQPVWTSQWDTRAPAAMSHIDLSRQADAIVGCRRYRAGYNPLMRLNAWLYPKLVAWLFKLHLRDVNWIHAYRRELFQRLNLTQSGIPMLAETLVRLRDAGATFAEVEVQMRPRTAGEPSAASLRVMARTLQGLLAFWHIWRKGTSARST